MKMLLEKLKNDKCSDENRDDVFADADGDADGAGDSEVMMMVRSVEHTS